jgi:hypothetical protein
MHITPPETIKTVSFINRPASNTNIAASKIIYIFTVIVKTSFWKKDETDLGS